MRAPKFYYTATWDVGVAALRLRYPAIEYAIEDFQYALVLDYGLPEVPVDPDRPDVYAMRIDYPPLGAAGRQRFLVTYLSTEFKPPVGLPYREITMLRIDERP
jgi:hypothetical protein